MSIPLAPSAELCIRAMHLESKDEIFIRECVSRYSRPASFPETLTWIAYRLWNAVKSLFNRSDWQLASKFLLNHVISLAEKKNVFKGLKENPQGKPGTLVEKFLKDIFSVASNKILNACIECQQNNTEISQEKLDELDLEKAIKKGGILDRSIRRVLELIED